jgi:hypothetical protein
MGNYRGYALLQDRPPIAWADLEALDWCGSGKKTHRVHDVRTT